MAQKTRSDINSVIESNIFDNNNKEILASMVRAVLGDFKDSYFNLKDDQLKNYKYNGTQTLEQYLAEVVGSLPVYGTISGINVGNTGQGSGHSYAVSGIVSSASVVTRTDNNTLIEVNFGSTIANKKVVPTFTYTASDWNAQNDICYPVIRVISSTRINVALREVSNVDQDLTLQLIAF